MEIEDLFNIHRIYPTKIIKKKTLIITHNYMENVENEIVTMKQENAVSLPRPRDNISLDFNRDISRKQPQLPPNPITGRVQLFTV